MNIPLKIVIIFGGVDKEHNISINTVRSFIDHSNYNKNIDIFFMDSKGVFYKVPISIVYCNHYEDFYHQITKYSYLTTHELMAYLRQQNNIIVFNTIHGTFGEDGQLNGLFYDNQIPFTGCRPKTMEIGFDKFQFNELMGKYGLKNIKFFLLKRWDLKNLNHIIGDLDKKKYILKPRFSGSSLGTYVINKGEEIWPIIIDAWRNFGDMILEEFFEGIEFSMAIVDDRWHWKPQGKIIFIKTNGIYTYEKKYMINDQVQYLYDYVNEKLTKKIINQGNTVAKILNVKGVVRLDGILNDQGYIFNDFNTNPSMDQNSLLFKTKTGTLKEIFNHLIEENISTYYEYLLPCIKKYNKEFLNENSRENHLNLLKNFLQKLNYSHESLKLIDNLYKNPMDIHIITGGNSNEKNVALLSGSNVFLQLSKSLLFKPKIFCWHNEDIYAMDYGDCGFTLVENLVEHLKNPVNIHQWIPSIPSNELIFLGVHGGDGENGTLQKWLHNHQHNGCNEYFSELFMDKYKTSLKFHGNLSYLRILIDTNKKLYRYNWTDNFNDYNGNLGWLIYEDDQDLFKKIEGIYSNYPNLSELITSEYCWKPNNDGSSMGIKIIKNFKDFSEAMDEKGLFLMEQFIKGDHWIELTVGFIGNYCLTPSVTLSSGEFLTMEEKFQYGLGINLLEGQGLSSGQINFIKEKITYFMGNMGFNSYCRVDLFFNKRENSVYIIEVNSLPALTPATVLYQQGALEGLSQQMLLEVIILNDLMKDNK
jgi:D-alanine-D-alanine ligase